MMMTMNTMMTEIAQAPLGIGLMWAGALLCAAWFLVSGAGYLLDRRQLFGENVWVKPLRFSASLALHYATFAVVIGWLAPGWQTGLLMTGLGILCFAALVFQVGFIGIQAARAEPSHFNTKTPLMRKLEITMAIMAAVVTAPMAVIGAVVLVDTGFQMAEAARFATGFGLIIGTVMTFVSAYHLGMRQNPFFGPKPKQERRMPLLDWSLDRGDLRPAHFFATHMMQAMPIAGMLTALTLPEPLATSAAFVAVLVWTGVAVETYRLAVKGVSIEVLWRWKEAHVASV